MRWSTVILIVLCFLSSKSVVAENCSAVMRSKMELIIASKDKTEILLERLGEIIQKCPSYAAAYYNRGVLLLRLGRANEALAEMLKATDIDKNPLYKLGEANALLGVNDVKKARNLYESLLSNRDLKVRALQGLASIAFRNRDLSKAENYLNRARQIEDQNLILLADLGKMQEEKGDIKRALATYRKATGGGINRLAVLRLVKLLTITGKTYEAERIIRKASLNFPGDVEIALFFARVLIHAGKIQEAKEKLEDLEKNSLKDAKLMLVKAIFLYQQGKNRDAETILLETLHSYPDNAQIAGALGWFYTEQRQYGKARRYFEKSLKLGAENAIIHYNYAVLLDLMDRTAASEVHRQRAKELGGAVIKIIMGSSEKYF